ncbi:uncharacterized protein LOC128228074 [Mya arenaria]|uniref:uncharacterized protein LOC128228074 n=1 Tax=Mya arenaria TaxID=6604 RepID=UPI0022E3C297|nr:uncharacterized protein LOC128228074 [Mya arenaria]
MNDIITFSNDQAVFGADLGYIRSTLTQHFSDTRHHVTNPAYKGRARQFIYDEFHKHGLDTNNHDFTYLGVSYTNVIGVLKGEKFGKYEDKIVGVGAHYDTVNITIGVDDNGSGVTAMLESLRQIGAGNKGGKRRNNTIIFMAFDHEEYDSLDNGLIGSKIAIEKWLLPWLTQNYGQHLETLKPHGIIVLDTVMNYNSSAQSQIIPQRLYLFEPQPEFEIEKFGIDTQDVTGDAQIVFNNFFRGDHVNFWLNDIPAIFITDSANFRGQMQQCYHNACDNMANMLTDNNVRFLGKTVDTIAATLDKLSEAYNTNPSSASCNRDFISILWISIGLMLVMI